MEFHPNLRLPHHHQYRLHHHLRPLGSQCKVIFIHEDVLTIVINPIVVIVRVLFIIYAVHVGVQIFLFDCI